MAAYDQHERQRTANKIHIVVELFHHGVGLKKTKRLEDERLDDQINDDQRVQRSVDAIQEIAVLSFLEVTPQQIRDRQRAANKKNTPLRNKFPR